VRNRERFDGIDLARKSIETEGDLGTALAASVPETCLYRAPANHKPLQSGLAFCRLGGCIAA
jgi:hypothetical protein